MQKKVLVAISGGIDSAVAAALLEDAGYDVTAVYLCLRMGATFMNEKIFIKKGRFKIGLVERFDFL